MVRRTRCGAALLAAIVWAGLAAAAWGADDPGAWPQFKRDSARTGDNPGARLAFPLTRTTAVQFPAPIYASPAVVAGRVYVQDALGNVACIDARKNEVLWLTALGGFNNTSSPAVADGRVYVGSTTGALFVLDADTGKIVTAVPALGGVLTSPAVTAQGVYFNTFDGELIKIDRDGQVVWNYKAGRLSIVEMAVRGDTILLFAGTMNTYFHLLRDKGSEVEVISKESAPGNCVPQGGPVLLEDLTYAFQSFDSESGRFYIHTTKLATHTDVDDSRITPSTRGGLIYRGDKCFEPGTTPKLLWRVDPQVLYDGGFHSSPALAKDFLVVGSELGRVHFVPLEGDEKVRQPVWQFAAQGAGKPNGAVSSSPAVVDGAVYFGGEDGILYGLGQGTEAPIVKIPAATTKTGSAATASGRLSGSEWHTAGGSMEYSYVSQDQYVRPPFGVAWKTRVWSTYKCPMIVADGKVFCTGRGGPLTALDAATGKILWKTHHPGVESRPPAAYIDGKLLVMRIAGAGRSSPYVSGASGGPPGEGLWCHDAKTGNTLWHVSMPFRYHFNHDGLAAHDGRVFGVEIDDEGYVVAVAYSLADGSQAWRRRIEQFPQYTSKSRIPPRFSGVVAGGLWCVSFLDRGTMGIKPDTGEVAWINTELFITNRTRIASRDGTLVVFAASGDHALDAATGKPLWKGAAKLSPYNQALSDLYLSSQGKQGIYPTATCAWPVHCNGYWFSHDSFSTVHGANRMVCTLPADPAAFDGFLNPKQTVWGFTFLSNACPSPSPAYGRLYYSPNSEGVVYCFTPEPEAKVGSE